MNNKMKSLGFSDAKAVKPRLVMSVSGLEKMGKTHFALTAPEPIALFSTDIGEEGVVQKFKDKKIYVMDISRVTDGKDDEMVDKAEAEFARVEKAYLDLLRGNDVRTIIFDTATEIWELLRMARFGRLTQVMPYQYGPVNKEYRSLIRLAYNHDKNLILLHKMKKKYVGDSWSGDYERAGFNDTGYLTQVNAQVYRYSRDDGGEFAILVKDSRHNPDMNDEELVGEMCNFDMVYNMVMM